VRFLDALAFSSLWVALAASALVWATSLALGAPPSVSLVALVFGGTLVVYGVDRLRDMTRDAAVAPRRTTFVAQHRRPLAMLVGLSALVSVGAAGALGWRPVALLLPVLGLGLLHRRIKRFAWAKSAYVVLAWLMVVVGLPALTIPSATDWPWAALVLGPSLLANAIASNVRDHEAGVRWWGARRALSAARTAAVAGVVLGAAAPVALRALGIVPLATLVALGPFRADERYGLLVVDGALLAGGAAAVLVLAGR
jgi:hypothetical protein